MSTHNHTAITTGAAANAATFNTPLGTLDAAVGDLTGLSTTPKTSVAGAIGGTALGTTATTISGAIAEHEGQINSQAATLAVLQASIILGGAAVTLANGAASAGQKVVVVDSTAQFVAGSWCEYQLVGGIVERNQVDSVDSATQLTLITNIGTGGIADDTPIAVIPLGFANAMLGIYNVRDYGATGDGATNDRVAIQAAIDAAHAAGGGVVYLPAGNYKITSGVILDSDVWLRGSGAENTTITFSGATGAALKTGAENTGIYRNITISDLAVTATTARPCIDILSGDDAGFTGGNYVEDITVRDVLVTGFGASQNIRIWPAARRIKLIRVQSTVGNNAFNIQGWIVDPNPGVESSETHPGNTLEVLLEDCRGWTTQYAVIDCSLNCQDVIVRGGMFTAGGISAASNVCTIFSQATSILWEGVVVDGTGSGAGCHGMGLSGNAILAGCRFADTKGHDLFANDDFHTIAVHGSVFGGTISLITTAVTGDRLTFAGNVCRQEAALGAAQLVISGNLFIGSAAPALLVRNSASFTVTGNSIATGANSALWIYTGSLVGVIANNRLVCASATLVQVDSPSTAVLTILGNSPTTMDAIDRLNVVYTGTDTINPVLFDVSGSALDTKAAFGLRLPATGAQKGLMIWKSTDGTAFVEFGYNVGGTGKPGLGLGVGGSTARDVLLYRDAADVLRTPDALAVDKMIELTEMTAPGVGAANTARVYAKDNGAGKTQLMVQFATGGEIQLAIEA